ncbi:MAG: phage integrase N-terminal SAM-like domain-containing protein, partial [Ignavibacteria bacterium]|nr:phage integrase N-terminal SAM-like domain-containing protein [Ignavibacteria bacterium]
MNTHPPDTTPAPGLLETVRRELRLRNYSQKTIKPYVSCLRTYIRFLRPLHPRDARDENIRRFILSLIESGDYAPSTINQKQQTVGRRALRKRY